MMWRIAAVVLAVAAAAALPPAIRHLRETPPPPEAVLRLTIDPPPGTEFGGGGLPFDLAIHPAGTELVFAATTAGDTQLWRRRLDALRAEPIAGTSGATMPAYGADARTLYYFAAAKLHAVDLATGQRREIADAAVPSGISPREDGTLLVGAGGPIRRIDGRGSAPVTTMRPGDREHGFPAWVGEGDAFVYLATEADGRRVLRLHAAGDEADLTRADSHGVVAAGHLLYVRDGILRAERLDVEAKRIGPQARTLALNVGVSPQGRGAFAVADRLLASGPPSRASYVLRWVNEAGAVLRTITEPADYWQVRLSPDEQTVAVTIRDPLLRTLDVFTMPAAGGAPSRVSLSLAADTDPVWSPDGRRIAFRSFQEGQPQLHVRGVARGSGGDVLLWQSPLDEVPTDWNASHLVFHARTPASASDIWALAPNAEAPRPLARSGFNEVDGRVSPDGRWLAYVSDEGGQSDVYIRAVAGGDERARVSSAGGTRPQWLEGGRGLVFRRGAEVVRATVVPTPDGWRTSTPQVLFSMTELRDVATSRDGRRFLLVAPEQSAPREGFPVVVGWKSLLQLDLR
jgi:eukaryotic-like serine/threonine-protein kinase